MALQTDEPNIQGEWFPRAGRVVPVERHRGGCMTDGDAIPNARGPAPTQDELRDLMLWATNPATNEAHFRLLCEALSELNDRRKAEENQKAALAMEPQPLQVAMIPEEFLLQERLLHWQRQLRLEDWDCTVELVTRRELQDGSTATTWLNPSLKKARIRILSMNEQEPPSERTGEHDLEQTLVHELLHIHFALWRGEAETRDTPEFCAKESGINQVAEALVSISRGIERR